MIYIYITSIIGVAAALLAGVIGKTRRLSRAAGNPSSRHEDSYYTCMSINNKKCTLELCVFVLCLHVLE